MEPLQSTRRANQQLSAIPVIAETVGECPTWVDSGHFRD
jgi:hypothetical protein